MGEGPGKGFGWLFGKAYACSGTEKEHNQRYRYTR